MKLSKEIIEGLSNGQKSGHEIEGEGKKMTIREGREQGIKRFRVRSDIETDACLKFDGGPWVRLYCRKEQGVTELPTPQEFTLL